MIFIILTLDKFFFFYKKLRLEVSNTIQSFKIFQNFHYIELLLLLPILLQYQVGTEYDKINNGKYPSRSINNSSNRTIKLTVNGKEELYFEIDTLDN